MLGQCIDFLANQAHCGTPSTQWETIMESVASAIHREPWNKGKIVGQKSPFKVKDIWALRVRLQMEHRIRELGMRIKTWTGFMRLDQVFAGIAQGSNAPEIP